MAEVGKNNMFQFVYLSLDRGVMEEDNIKMIEAITKKKVVALVRDGAETLDIDPQVLADLYKEVK